MAYDWTFWSAFSSVHFALCFSHCVPLWGALSSSLVDLKWLIMFAIAQRFYDFAHLAYRGHIMKLTLHSLHSSTKWIMVKCWPGCIQNGRDKIAADGSCEMKNDSKDVVQGREIIKKKIVNFIFFLLFLFDSFYSFSRPLSTDLLL